MDRVPSSPPSQRQELKTRVKADRRERQIVRILALLRVLSYGRTSSVHELAAEFRTRRETIYRDLRVLQDAGYPVAGDERGRLSHPRLLPSGVPDIRFTPAELDALHAAAEQVQVALPDSTTLRSAKTKLKALARSEQEFKFSPNDELFESWTRGAKEYADHRAQLSLLIEAILRLRRCHIVYRKPSLLAPKKYDFDPYRLLLVGGGLYVIGKVPKYDDVATLAVDRILSVALTTVNFNVSSTFDPKRCREQAFGVSWQDPQSIVLRFRADQAPYVQERVWHPTQQLTSRPDGSLEMVFHAGGPFEIRRWILGWGDAVEVISPDHLRKEIERVMRSALSSYANGQTPL